MRIKETSVRADQISVGEGDELGGIAVFFDLENIVLGIEGEFRVRNIIEALTDRGEVMTRRAYADWGRYRRYQKQFLEEGVEMAFLPSYGVGDKNRTDTAICVDAMELMFLRDQLDTFVIVSGDSDFGVLARRLRDYGKRVVGISAKSAASRILVNQCHEFIFYETLVGQMVSGYSNEDGEARLKRALMQILDNYGDTFRASLLKDRMRKHDPTFSEKNYGASSFTVFLRGYPHLVQVLEGGMVRGLDPESSPRGSRGGTRGEGRYEGRGDSRPNGERPSRGGRGDSDGPSEPPKLLPELADECRAHLRRAMEKVAPDGGSSRLNKLKDALEEVAPGFDELGLGFRSFTQFLKSFPDVISLDGRRHQARLVTDSDEGRPGTQPTTQAEPGSGDAAAASGETAAPEAVAPAEPVTAEGPADETEDTPKPGRGRGRGLRSESKVAIDPALVDDDDDRPTSKLSRAERRKIRAAARAGIATAAEPAEAATPASDAPVADAAPAEPKKAPANKAAAKEAADGQSSSMKSPAKKAAANKAPAKKAAANKAPAKKAAAKKAPANKAPANKASADEPVEEKAPATKAAAKKAPAKKAAAKKAPAKKAAAKKAPAKKAAADKASDDKAPANKAAANKAAAKKAPAKKAAAKKAPAKKAAAKKAPAKKAAANKAPAKKASEPEAS